jgi:hypothetical protein
MRLAVQTVYLANHEKEESCRLMTDSTVRDLYRALASADRDGIEGTLADDVRFSRPVEWEPATKGL